MILIPHHIYRLERRMSSSRPNTAGGLSGVCIGNRWEARCVTVTQRMGGMENGKEDWRRYHGAAAGGRECKWVEVRIGALVEQAIPEIVSGSMGGMIDWCPGQGGGESMGGWLGYPGKRGWTRARQSHTITADVRE